MTANTMPITTGDNNFAAWVGAELDFIAQTATTDRAAAALAAQNLAITITNLAASQQQAMSAQNAALLQTIASETLALKNEIFGGNIPEATNSLSELLALINDNAAGMAQINALKVIRYDAVQTITDVQKGFVRTTIGAASSAEVDVIRAQIGDFAARNQIPLGKAAYPSRYPGFQA
jgi:hypothetical protein